MGPSGARPQDPRSLAQSCPGELAIWLWTVVLAPGWATLVAPSTPNSGQMGVEFLGSSGPPPAFPLPLLAHPHPVPRPARPPWNSQVPGRLPPAVAGPGCCRECGGGSGHCGASAWWGGAGQRQVGSARIPKCAQAVIALDAGQRIVFHNHHPLPEDEKKGTTTKTTTKFFCFCICR